MFEKPILTHKIVSELEIAILTYSDGTRLTTSDWQGKQPKTLDEVKDYDWHLYDEMVALGDGEIQYWDLQRTAMVNGFPYLFELF